MPNGQAHLMVNLAEDEFRTSAKRMLRKCANSRGPLLPGLMPNRWSSILERNAGSLPSSFDMGEPLVFSQCR